MCTSLFIRISFSPKKKKSTFIQLFIVCHLNVQEWSKKKIWGRAKKLKSLCHLVNIFWFLHPYTFVFFIRPLLPSTSLMSSSRNHRKEKNNYIVTEKAYISGILEWLQHFQANLFHFGLVFIKWKCQMGMVWGAV